MKKEIKNREFLIQVLRGGRTYTFDTSGIMIEQNYVYALPHLENLHQQSISIFYFIFHPPPIAPMVSRLVRAGM
jgi:hypothetical protein